VRSALLLLAALAACGVPAAPEPCPGDLQGRLVLRASPAEGEAAACATAADLETPDEVTVVVSFTADGGAVLCPDRPLADPLRGTRAGDAIAVASAARPAPVAACDCAQVVVERLEGTLVRDGAGAVVGLSGGRLVNELAPADAAASCPGAVGCPLRCSVSWSVQARP
jgi:hypothetical protein